MAARARERLLHRGGVGGQAFSDGLRRAYDELVARSAQRSVFAASWWLDAVAPGRWQPNLLLEHEEAVAAWPLVESRGQPARRLGGAPLTPFLGPLLREDTSQHRWSRQIDQVESLVGRLGHFVHLESRCNPGFDYWTPLYWHGFRQTTAYTWRLPDLRDLEGVFANLRVSVRTPIRKAGRDGVTVSADSLDQYLALHERTLERQGRTRRAVRDVVIKRAVSAAVARGAASIVVARDRNGVAHAGAVFVHDDRFTYYLLSARDDRYRSSGAGPLVLWHGIELAAARGNGFDFEGSMIRPVERFVRAFGGEPVPYSIISRTSAAYRAVAAGRTAARQVRQHLGRVRPS